MGMLLILRVTLYSSRPLAYTLFFISLEAKLELRAYGENHWTKH